MKEDCFILGKDAHPGWTKNGISPDPEGRSLPCALRRPARAAADGPVCDRPVRGRGRHDLSRGKHRGGFTTT